MVIPGPRIHASFARISMLLAWISVIEKWISMLESMLAWIWIMDIHASIDLKIHAGHGYPWCSFGSMDLSMDIHTCRT